jgi:hypothetical protein
VSITRDGRRLDSKEAVLAWLAEVDADRAAGRLSTSMTSESPALDVDRLLTTLDRHEVDFVLVGGVAAIAYGGRPPTADLDCVARRSSGNFERLAAALRSLNARLLVHGLTDEEATLLPTRIDKDTLGRMELST